jgi:CMP-N-acetylneuraminic acid synthetase
LFFADKYNLADLVFCCEESIMSKISDDTVLDIAVSSRLLASQEVYKAAKKFIESRPIKSFFFVWKMFKNENSKEAKEITQKPTKKNREISAKLLKSLYKS